MEPLLNEVDGHIWTAQERRGHCFEHIVHLGGKAFILAIGPVSPRSLEHNTAEGADDDDIAEGDEEDDSDIEDENVNPLLDGLDAALDAEEVDDVVEYDAGDVLGKALALVNQVCVCFYIYNIIAWKVAGEFVRPKNITKGSKSPRLVLKAAFHSSPSLMRMFSYPQRTSTLEKIRAPLSLSTISLTSGRG
ncbi:hypothetical protein K488DRAFT_64477 [Vararia minispora EC-137]|uniref:Uncharacterized protein n=1 Tax=Vararia minispora EC-137 TaxID=1314806 RepID=A0ACB8Q5A2_9AGAM|nr:hypothetical protein K488DRAFT_64477 [Vararia minispora EC-137]